MYPFSLLFVVVFFWGAITAPMLQAADSNFVELKQTSTSSKEPVAIDQRIAEALDAENISYTVNESEEALITIEWTNDSRSQIIHVPSKTFSWKKHEYRGIYSFALKIEDKQGLERSLANRLLQENSETAIGFWSVQNNFLFYVVAIPAHASSDFVRQAIFFVGEKADEMEKELLKTDDY
jgi:hypothetical protein